MSLLLKNIRYFVVVAFSALFLPLRTEISFYSAIFLADFTVKLFNFFTQYRHFLLKRSSIEGWLFKLLTHVKLPSLIHIKGVFTI